MANQVLGGAMAKRCQRSKQLNPFDNIGLSDSVLPDEHRDVSQVR